MSRLNRYVVVDLETTGLGAKLDRIIEIGAVRVEEGKVVETYACLVNPGMPVPERVQLLTGITTEMVRSGKEMDEAVQGLLDFMGNDVMVGHNVNFDYSFLKQWAVNHKIPLEIRGTDTLKMARAILPPEQPKKLESLCALFDIPRDNAHRALDDAVETYLVYEKLCGLFEAAGKEIPDSVPIVYHAKRQTPATAKQVERLKEFRSRKGITEEINWETLTRSEASRIQDKYYETYGR